MPAKTKLSVTLIKSSAWLFIAIGVPGCVRPSYDPPAAYPDMILSEEVPLSKEKAWGVIMKNLAEKLFSINNIDKESGFINVDYSGDAIRFVDCGVFHFHNLSVDWDYNLADKFNKDGLSHSAALDGRANLLLVPISPNSSKFSVHIRYVVTTSQYQNGVGGSDRSVFDSNGVSKHAGAEGYCRPNGELERDFLQMPLHVPSS